MNPSTTFLLVSLLAACPSAQEPKDNNPELPGVTRITEIERLFRAYGLTHGGREALRDLETLSFSVIPIQISEEGEQEQAPIHVDAQLNGIDRIMRLEEEIDGRSVVKFADGIQEVSIFVNGEEREIPEMIESAREEANLFYVALDLLYKPESPDFKAVYQGEKKRNGELYHVADYEFHTSRLIPYTYRLYYDMKTGLVERIDVHDTRTQGNLRIYSMYPSEYDTTAQAKADAEETLKEAEARVAAAETPEEKAHEQENLERVKLSLRSPQFPGRIKFVSRDGEPWIVWRMVDYVANAEFEPGHFSEP